MIIKNVLSLFDGMSCGQIALNRIGVKYENYFASEIDKHAIKVTQHNYPNTMQLGSVVDIQGSSLPKIDLLMGGSPCQSFSFAGKRKGMSTKSEIEILTLDHYLELKEKAFEFEGQSYLFWEYMRLLNETKPKYFLLENVLMSKKWEEVLTRAIGVEPVMINSALVSAQSRKRLYWTDIGLEPIGLFGDLHPTIEQPKDKGILLKHILEENVDEKYYLSERMVNKLQIKNNPIGNIIGHSGTGGQKGLIYNTEGRVGSLCATDYKQPKQIMCVAMRGRGENNEQQLEQRKDNKTNCLTSVQKDNLFSQIVVTHNLQPRSPNRPSLKKNKNACGSGYLQKYDVKSYCLDTGNTQGIEIIAGDYRIDEGFRWRKDDKTPTLTCRQDESAQPVIVSQPRIYDDYNQRTRTDEKTSTLTPNTGSPSEMNGQKLISQNRIRRLTARECEELQTIPVDYTNVVSESQRYKMIGNGWTIDVITHILKYIK